MKTFENIVFLYPGYLDKVVSDENMRRDMEMVLHVTDPEYLDIFAGIYNSAIELFDENARGAATADTFASQLENDENFVEIQEDGSIAAFMSYHRYGRYYELTSLYVEKEFQRKGVGHMLLCHFEQMVGSDGIIFLKVLKNAPWSLSFYTKNGYVPVDAKMRKTAELLNITEKVWSVVLYKDMAL